MDKTILITRPRGDERSMMAMLQALGYRVIHEPLMDVTLCEDQRYTLHRALMADPDGILVTSRQGVQALAQLTDLRDAFVLCVGEATARAALSAGFTRVRQCGGTAAQMLRHIRTGYDEGTRFIYASGDHISADLPVLLGQSGMAVERIVVYEAAAAQQLSDTLVEQLRRRQIDGAAFLSRRTAQIFMELAETHDVEESVESMRAFSISESVADLLGEWPWLGVYTAGEPTLASVVKSIDNVFLANG